MAAPQTMVNSKGYPIGEQVDRVIFPPGEYVGEQTAEYDAGSVRTAAFFLDWTETGGAANLDLVIDAKNPATGQWVPLISFTGVATAVGLVVCMVDPLVVQADFDAAKVRVIRAHMPNVMRIRVVPNNQVPQTYSLACTVQVG